MSDKIDIDRARQMLEDAMHPGEESLTTLGQLGLDRWVRVVLDDGSISQPAPIVRTEWDVDVDILEVSDPPLSLSPDTPCLVQAVPDDSDDPGEDEWNEGEFNPDDVPLSILEEREWQMGLGDY